MATWYVLCNNTAGYKDDTENVKRLSDIMSDTLKFIDIMKIKDYKLFFSELANDDYIVLSGGDGTLNRFVNDTEGLEVSCEILYFPNGTGNDFAHELGQSKGSYPFSVTKYLKELPLVIVNGKKYRFINGIGYGIDGYCCEVGDKLKETTDKKINYTSIAINGLLMWCSTACAIQAQV